MGQKENLSLAPSRRRKEKPAVVLISAGLRRVRLANGETDREGNVEVMHDGKWGGICGQGFGKDDAHLVCRYS